jgi:TnpA family transposase
LVHWNLPTRKSDEPVIKGACNVDKHIWELIRQQYDQMVKYATALRLGTVETESMLRRFTSSVSAFRRGKQLVSVYFNCFLPSL